jgi:transposase-like protein
MTRAERRTHWRTIVENQATSGVNITAYCREAQIKPFLFYSWRRRLREQQPCAGGFLELIPGRLTEAANSGIHIRLGRKLAIEVERGFDPFTLRAVVETLSGLSQCSA